MIGYELTRWMAFRRIKHAGAAIYIWWIPSILTICAAAAYLITPAKPHVFGSDSLADMIFQFFAILPGFFLAALAAVSTFENSAMDEDLPAPAPTLVMRINGDPVVVELSLRMVVSYLFSYLTMMSIIIVILSGIAKFLFEIDHMRDYLHGAIFQVNLLGVIIFSFLSSSVFVSLTHGLYFITERIHQPN